VTVDDRRVSRTLLVVEDDAVFRAALVREIRAPLEALACGSVAETTRKLAELDAPLAGAILDLHLPDGSGLDVLKELRSRFPGIPVMVLTGWISADLINQTHALDADFVAKPHGRANMTRFLQEVLVDSCAAGRALHVEATVVARSHGLTRREHELLAVAISGVPRRKLAEALGVVEDTVKSLIRRILHKTGDESLVDLIWRVRTRAQR
jgi:two-component system response regulator DevR